jgi:hypothetical protein
MMPREGCRRRSRGTGLVSLTGAPDHRSTIVLAGASFSVERLQSWKPCREGALAPAVIAETFVAVLYQSRSAWSHEIDLRPWRETL